MKHIFTLSFSLSILFIIRSDVMMSSYSNIRRQWYSFIFGRKIRSKRSIISIVIILIISILIIVKRKESCWLDYYRSRLFCFVLTNQDHLEDRARAVYETWGHRCGKFIFISRLNSSRSYTIYDNENNFINKTNQLPIQYIPTLPDENYSHLSDKIRATLLFIYKYYPNYDWYLKADDDTYIIIENLLRFLISTIKRRPKPILYGYRFREDYYVSGGGGYVITNDGIKLFGKYMNDDYQYSRCNISSEDMMVGTCFKNIIQIEDNYHQYLTIVGETIDHQGRERFHPLAFRLHFNGPAIKFKREWIHVKPFHHILFGYEGISETTISFHYTKPADMYEIHSLLYDIRLFHKQVCFQHL